NSLGGEVHLQWASFRNFEFRYVGRVVPIWRSVFSQRRTVKDIKLSVLLKLGMQSQPQNTAFIEAFVQRSQAGLRRALGYFPAVGVLEKEPVEPQWVSIRRFLAEQLFGFLR